MDKDTAAAKAGNSGTDRIVSFDYLRVAAAAAIMLLHTASQNWGKSDVSSLSWQIFNAYDSIARWGMSVFVMISGTLFLSRDIPFSRILKKYIPRLLCAYCFWSALWFLLSGKSASSRLAALFGDNTASSVASLIKGPAHLWFLPMMCGLYLCTPLLRAIVKNEFSEKLFLMLALLFTCVFPQCLTLIKDFCGKNPAVIADALSTFLGNAGIQTVTGYGAFFVLGHFLTNRKFTKKERIWIYAAGLAGFAATILLTSAASLRSGQPLENYYYAHTVNVALEAASVFIFFKYRFTSPGKCYPFIRKMSDWSFGAFLVHLLIITLLKNKTGLGTLSFHPALSVPVITLITFILSFGISALLNQIPGIRRYIL